MSCKARGTPSMPGCRKRWCSPACCTTSRRWASSAATMAIGARSWSYPMSTRKLPGRIRAHQVLRFYPDEAVGYEYPASYVKTFGADYRPDDYVEADYKRMRDHKWYMSGRMITVHDIYSFDPDVQVELDEFTDVIGRNFRQPKEGLGFDNSPVAHMWRAMIRPAKYL